MRYISIFFILLLYITVNKDAFPEFSFKPWGSKVSVADEKIKIVFKMDFDKIKSKKHYTYSHKSNKDMKRVNNIYNGVQGGAYFLIRFFQVFISPQDGPNCRYNPVCTVYARKAVEKYGALLGSMLAGDRLIRCNPYSPHGKDPVPENIFGD